MIFLNRGNLKISLFSLYFSTVTTGYAYAYIDPGTGSYLFQLVVAGLIALLFTVKSFWFKIKEFIKKILGRDSL